jgi:hypothetical protein
MYDKKKADAEWIRARFDRAKGWLLGQLNIVKPLRSVNCTICYERIKMGEDAVRRITGQWNGNAKRNYICAKCGLKLAEEAASKFAQLAASLRDYDDDRIFANVRMIKTYEISTSIGLIGLADILDVDLDQIPDEAILEEANERVRYAIGWTTGMDVHLDFLSSDLEEVADRMEFPEVEDDS